MIVNTWTGVWWLVEAAGKGIASRLHAYWPPERKRREAARQEAIARLKADIEQAMREDDDYVGAWMAEAGFDQHVTAYGIDEQTEVAITEASNEFRRRIREIVGDDAQVNVEIAC